MYFCQIGKYKFWLIFLRSSSICKYTLLFCIVKIYKEIILSLCRFLFFAESYLIFVFSSTVFRQWHLYWQSLLNLAWSCFYILHNDFYLQNTLIRVKLIIRVTKDGSKYLRILKASKLNISLIFDKLFV